MKEKKIHLYIKWLCTLILQKKIYIGKYSKLASQTPNNSELNYLQCTKNAMNLAINLQDVLPFKEKNHIILEWKDIINGAINSWIGRFSTIKFSPEWPIDLIPMDIPGLIKISM